MTAATVLNMADTRAPLAAVEALGWRLCTANPAKAIMPQKPEPASALVERRRNITKTLYKFSAFPPAGALRFKNIVDSSGPTARIEEFRERALNESY